MQVIKRFSFQGVALFLCSAMLLAGCNSGSSDNRIQMGGAIQGAELVLFGDTATIVGAAEPAEEGYRTAVAFQGPYGITSDGSNLYVTEMYANIVRKIDIATGEVTTLAGVTDLSGSNDSSDGIALFDMLLGITTDGTHLYVCDGGNNTIRRVEIATGFLSTIAGSAGITGFADGTGTQAQFSNPNSIATDGINLYVSDMHNHTIPQIVIATGAVTTLAGSAGAGGSIDGSGAAARFNNLNGIVTDGVNLYVADTYNNTIRQVTIATAEVTTLAGSAGNAGSTDGIGSAARFQEPRGLTLDGSDLYVVDSINNTIRKVSTTTGEVTTSAGIPLEGGANDAIGAEAQFNGPRGIVAVENTLYVADLENHLVRAVDISTPENRVTTFAGFLDHQFNAITTDGANLYVSDQGTRTIQKVEIASGELTTLAGRIGANGSTDGDASTALFNYPAGMTTDGTNLYVTDYFDNTIRQVSIATGEVTTLAGSAGTWGSADGIGSAAEFDGPYGITTDGTNLYVSDVFNYTIRQIVIATGAVTTLAGSPGNAGFVDGAGSDARFNYPAGITTDGTNLYAADTYNNAIRQIDIATGAVTTLAHRDAVLDLVNDIFTPGLFNSPIGITTDGANLYVTDSINNTISKVVIATGEVTIVAGNADSSGATDGPASVALFDGPTGITTDGKSLYVTDSYNKIRSVQ
ncbi:MAG: hypothetical protein WCX90_10225 [Thiohalomonadaceae bacterium]